MKYGAIKTPSTVDRLHILCLLSEMEFLTELDSAVFLHISYLVL